MKSLIDTLEPRRLFSFAAPAPMTAAMLYQQTYSATHAPAAVNESPVAQLTKAAAKKNNTKPPSLLGRWDGEVEVDGFPFDWESDMDLHFNDISKDSKTAYGEIDIDHLDDYSGRWTGVTLNKTREFTYTLKKNGHKITIEGSINSKNTFASGELTIKWKHGGKTEGDFTLQKWK